MKFVCYLLALGGISAGIFSQVDLGKVGDYVSTLQQSKYLIATLHVVKNGGESMVYNIDYARGLKYRIDTPTTLEISDGKTLTILNKKANTYTQTDPESRTEFLKPTKEDAIAAYEGFFNPKAFATATGINDQGSKQIEGTKSEVYEITFPKSETMYLYIEPTTGLASGVQITRPDTQIVSISTKVNATTNPLPDSTFAFVPPTGATKVVLTPGTTATGYAAVDQIFQNNCVKCHSDAGRHSGGLSLSTYASLMKGGSGGSEIVAGNPEQSTLYQYISGALTPRMPRNASPLSDSDIKVVYDWIKAGATGP